MPYTPHTEADIREMLAVIGVDSIEDLFHEVPGSIQSPVIQLPEALTEEELRRDIARLTANNQSTQDLLSFLGGGAYDRIRPSLVDRLLSRSEFATSYTPYQAEVSQGTLQFIFEFQTLIARLTCLEAANASMYDGASALAEAALMSLRTRKKGRILMASTIHPRWKETVRAYLTGVAVDIIEIPDRNGTLDLDALASESLDDVSCVLVQSPNFFGYLEDLGRFGEIIRKSEALWVQASDPVSLGLLKAPGDWGADIAVGELQSLGLPLSFGGPYAGYFACRQSNVRQMPGRIVGKTLDAEGRTGYVLTLQTREQHIRRDKATSNICTNQSLCALGATIYLSMMGPEGLRDVARQNMEKAHYFASRLVELPGVKLLSDAPFFNEFTLVLDRPAVQFAEAARAKGVLPGIFEPRWTGNDHRLIVCVTETKTRDQIDQAVEIFRSVLKP